ncbi:DUF983 domain-containing protein [Botryobacter ruber]|uniref:DUF983 domain-containing protein n=1 Tax=Botryobacter ruber TaxID=2171629 RepID=UPI000E0AE825|nr:DUF983 domain-containing protein [Botryobacter ruber]
MSWKETKLYSILNFKCPRCHEGDMFEKGTLFNYRRFSRMNDKCSCCGQTFEPEPGFYYGAMFISYGFSTALFVLVWIMLSFLVEEVTLTMMVLTLIIIVVGLLPLTFRLSRSIWLNIFVKYQGPCQPQK